MIKIYKLFIILTAFCLISALPFTLISTEAAAAYKGLSKPVLKYAYAGCYEWWCEESRYSSPVVVDLDKDGSLEIIYSAYSIFVLDAATGKLEWRVNSGLDRSSEYKEVGGNIAGHTYSDIVVDDIDADGRYEIISGHSKGYISVYNNEGYFEKGWPQKPVSGSIRSVKAYDLDNDGTKEILVGAGVSNATSVYVYEHTGELRKGWPQLSGEQLYTNNTDFTTSGVAYGVFCNNLSAGDLDNDADLEIVAPTDVQFISAFEDDGTLLKANSELWGGKTWSRIGLFEDYLSELRNDNCGELWGYGTPILSREDCYMAQLGHSGSIVMDVDGNGSKEIIVTAMMMNFARDERQGVTMNYIEGFTPKYFTLFILNTDRTRYVNQKLGFDWRYVPTDLGEALSFDYENVIYYCDYSPVAADMDGDGYTEFLFASPNGKVHCFSLDGTEHGAWPYSLVTRTDPVYEYATMPTCRDLDGDKEPEVIFASWTSFDKKTNPSRIKGRLYILSSEGRLLYSVELPDTKDAVGRPNCSLNNPAVADIDKDGELEIIVNTMYAGVCVYDVPGSVAGKQ